MTGNQELVNLWSCVSKLAKRWWFRPAVGIVLVIVAFALSFRRDRARLVVAIHEGVESIALKGVIQRFAKFKGVIVDVVELPYEDLFRAEMNELAKSECDYDVIMVDDPWLPALLRDPAKDPPNTDSTKLRLREIPLSKIEEEDFFESCLLVCQDPNNTTPQRKVYALPFVGNSQLLCYRDSGDQKWKDMTWEEFMNRPEGNKVGYVARIGPGNSILTDFLPFLLEESTEDSTKKETNKSLELSPLGEEQLRRRLYQIWSLSRSSNTGGASFTDFDIAVQMVSGKAKVGIVWSAWAMAIANLEQYKQGASKGLGFSSVPGTPLLGAWLLAVPEKSDNQKRAVEFVQFATNPKQLCLAAYQGNPPPRKSLYNDAELPGRYPSFCFQRHSLEKARPRPRTPHWNRLETKLASCLTEVIAEAITVDAAVCEMNKAIKQVQDARNGPLPPSFIDNVCSAGSR